MPDHEDLVFASGDDSPSEDGKRKRDTEIQENRAKKMALIQGPKMSKIHNMATGEGLPPALLGKCHPGIVNVINTLLTVGQENNRMQDSLATKELDYITEIKKLKESHQKTTSSLERKLTVAERQLKEFKSSVCDLTLQNGRLKDDLQKFKTDTAAYIRAYADTLGGMPPRPPLNDM